jgi:predicted O-methyltransferase YrrM
LLIRQKLFQVQEYFHYLMSQVDEHSLHAPFIFDLYTKVIKGSHGDNHDEIELIDLGAGSIVRSSDTRSISNIARYSISSVKTARLISRITAFSQPSIIIELGTSLGLLSLQLHHGCPKSRIYTIEGAPALHALAQSHFKQYSSGQIVSLCGNIDELLPGLMEKVDQIDLAVMDANHTLQGTLTYFYTLIKRCHQGSVIIVDDIHWSKEMRQAWDEIRSHPEVTCSIDLFQIGVVFFREELNKQHWTLIF